ncbi:MAG: amidophosphoribosyltransferase [Hirschia sp.]|nr:amidophosphoribosyltransferase [Hirschia sp.]MBF20039.1 amidophosphoribosyltransferase [Hirschia sp.]
MIQAPSSAFRDCRPLDNDDDFGEAGLAGRHKCGVFGVYGDPNAAALTALGLHALQHRGQEACGIASYDIVKNSFQNERHLGLVGDCFGQESGAIQRLTGSVAIGHNRYSTSGRVAQRNIQPLFADLKSGGFAIAHNGNLTNARTLRDRLVQDGAIFQSTMDTEVILHLIARSMRTRLVDRFIDAVSHIQGGFGLVCLTNKKLIGARDPWGLRPLVLGQTTNGAYVLASESCALDAVGAQFIRDVDSGEVIVISDKGVQSHKPFATIPARPCVFEYLYFARPDSTMHGLNVNAVREELGRQLAAEHHVDADMVCPVPDGGNPSGLGFSEASGIPFKFGIIRNHYIGRTFIQPNQMSRQRSVSLKHSANRSAMQGKRVVLVDDSIVRGNTSRRIVEMVRAAGAAEIHFRVASPPIRYPDFYGIDMPSKEELLASQMSIEEMRDFLGVDSLGFLSLDGFHRALGQPEGRNNKNPQFADHCFTGEYPTALIDHEDEEEPMHEQLSLLKD